MGTWLWAAVLSVGGIGGCGSDSSSTAATSGGTTSGSTSGSTSESNASDPSGASSSSGADSNPGSDSSGDSGSSTGASSGLPPGVPPGFLVDPDVSWAECSRWDQNCPPGEKCAAWANDGGNSWNSTRCVPIVPNPAGPGEPCTVEGSGVSGLDTCDIHSTCFNVDQDLQGTCFPLCVGSESNPQCNEPDHHCVISGDGILTLCLPSCNPLLEDCEETEGCYPSDATFVCAPDASGVDQGAPGDPCEFINACDRGAICAQPDLVGLCEAGSAGCCTSVCDTSVADPCPDPQICFPWYEPGFAPFGRENVGVCLEFDR